MEDDAIALEAGGAFGILGMKGEMGLNMQDQVGDDALTLSIRNDICGLLESDSLIEYRTFVTLKRWI